MSFREIPLKCIPLTGLFIHVGEALAPLGLLLSGLPSATHGSLLWDAAFLCRGGTGGVIFF